jgi:hypothetical protein
VYELYGKEKKKRRKKNDEDDEDRFHPSVMAIEEEKKNDAWLV